MQPRFFYTAIGLVLLCAACGAAPWQNHKNSSPNSNVPPPTGPSSDNPLVQAIQGEWVSSPGSTREGWTVTKGMITHFVEQTDQASGSLHSQLDTGMVDPATDASVTVTWITSTCSGVASVDGKPHQVHVVHSNVGGVDGVTFDGALFTRATDADQADPNATEVLGCFKQDGTFVPHALAATPD